VQRQLLSIQRQSAERLLQLVTAVLDQAKVESEPMAVSEAPCVPRMLAAEVVELFAPQAHRRGVEIIWTADPALPRRVLCDAIRMRQILSNLVSNAVKFTDQGNVQVHLAPSSPGRMRIDVRDTGRGVAPERLGAIFERFVSDAGSEERALSTGLGLPICRDLALAMGGRITATSRLNEGSCFSLDLPCLPAAADPADEVLPYKPPPGRLWVVGASAPLATQLRFILGEMGVDSRFVDSPPGPDDWAAQAGQDTPRQALLLDTWSGHGRCVDQVPRMLDEARQAGRRVIVVNSVAQDAAFGVLDDVWQVFRPPSWDALQEALSWAFGHSADPAAGQPAAARPLRVLLVDDNTVNQIIGKAMLDAMHAAVTAAHDGQEALDELMARPFDLVLMDLQMPGMDGLEATRRLRQHEREHGLPRTPVLAVTGQDGAEVQRSCREAGMDEVLVKPYTVDQLRTAIDLHAVVSTR
jgi:CheY-like chemotaxis protein